MSAVSKQPAFLAAFKATASITRAASACDIERGMHYRWLKEDPEYAAAFEGAKDEAAQSLEDEAIRRAKEGVLKPVLYHGHRCYEDATDADGKPVLNPEGQPLQEALMVREYSDALLQTLLKAWMPKKYRENVHIDGHLSHSGISALTDAELERIARGSSGGDSPAPAGEEQDPDVLPG